MAKISLSSILSGFLSASKLTENFQKIATEFQSKVLYRDNPTGEPNQMENDIDMNSNSILNVDDINATTMTLSGIPLVPNGVLSTDADQITFTPTIDILSTNVQAAIEEVTDNYIRGPITELGQTLIIAETADDVYTAAQVGTYTAINWSIIGDVDYTLTAPQARHGKVNLTDPLVTLTQTRNLIVPSSVDDLTVRKIYWINNETEQSIVVKTSTGSGVTVSPNTGRVVYCDGINVTDLLTGHGLVVSSKADALALPITEGRLVFITSDDGGQFVMRTGAAAGTYDDDGGDYCGTKFTDGDGSRGLERQFDNEIHAKWFGPIYTDFSVDSTGAIQRAINATSNSNIFEVVVPEGHIKFTRLYVGYDAINNPGFKSSGRQGKIRIKGAGCQDIASMRASTYAYGTLLESTVATGDAFIVTDAAGTPNYDFRAFELEDLQITGVTSGYVFRARACPEIYLRRAGIVQENIDGSGADIKSAWFAHIDHVRIINNAQTDPGTATGIGLDTGTEIFAGLYHVDHCLIDGFGQNHKFDVVTASQPFASMVFTQTAFQSATTHGSAVIGSCMGVHYDRCYWEKNASHDIYAVGSATKIIRHLEVSGGELVLSDGTTAYHTNPTIELDYVYSYKIDGVHIFNPMADMIKVGIGGGSQFVSGKVSNVNVEHSNLGALGAPIYLVAPTAQAAMPIIENPVFTNGFGRFLDAISNIRVYNTSSYKATVVDSKMGVLAGTLAASYKKHTASGAAIVLSTITPAEPVINIFDASANTSVQLPDGSAVSAYEGKTFILHNLLSSAGYINVTNQSDASVIERLAPGDWCLCHLDKNGTGKYYALKFVRNSVSADNGDASKTVYYGISHATQRFNTAITSDRTVTMDKTSVPLNGAKFRIVRGSSATGAYNINILNGAAGPTLKALAAAGTWADVEYTGSNWVLTAYGAL